MSDIDTLVHDLLGGMPIEDFDARVRERRSAHFAAALGKTAVDSLFNLRRLEALASDASASMSSIDLFDERHLRRLADVQHKSGRSALEVLAASFREGSTIRVRDADKLDASLSQLAAALGTRLMAQCQINVYFTPPTRTGFPPHFDITDVIIVQCLGEKQWRIDHDYTNQSPLPLPHTNWDPERFTPSGPPRELTLAAGDALYLPRGTMHEAFCTVRESLHLTISIAPLTWADLLVRAVTTAAEGDVELRRRIPWPTDMHDVGGAERLMREARQRLRDATEHADVTAALRSLRSELRPTLPTAATGVFEAAIADILESADPTRKNGSRNSPPRS